MEIRQLRHFVAVGEAGGISAAARKLGITQPALSRQIKSLEEETGSNLLERGAHSVTLTPAGEVLLSEARKLLRFADAMVEKVRVAGTGEPLRIGYAPSLAGEFFAVAIERFAQCHPRVRISLFDWSSAEMRAGLAEGKLDLIVAAPAVGTAEAIRWIGLCGYGWQVAMAKGHELAGKKKIGARDLEGSRVLLYDREQYPDYWARVTGFFREHRLQAKIAGEFDGVTSLMAALEANMGIALLSKSTMLDRGGKSRLVTRPLVPEPAAIEVAAGIPQEKECPLALQAFIEELKRAAVE